LCTLHSAKGLEWDHVFFVRLNDEVFPQKKDEDSILQERRLFYVGVTRAKKTLTLTYSKGEHSLSRFVREIHRPLLTWYSATQYRLSTSEFEGKSRHVRGIIDLLQGEDFRLLKEHPTAVLVYGDTNSTIAGSLAAAKIHIPVIHVEAGLRSFNKSMPEEVNRIACDHMSTLLFTPTKTGLDNLMREGFSKNNDFKAEIIRF
jgi:hypothetical protein